MPSAPSLDITKEVGAAIKALAPAARRINKSLRALDPEKLPIGALSDLFYDLRSLTSVLNTITREFDDVLPETVKLVEQFFINKLAVGESSGVQGKKSRTQITERMIPTADDWTKIYAHIKKTGEFELLNRAINAKAVQERWENKKQVPGVGKFNAKKVSCTKLSGK